MRFINWMLNRWEYGHLPASHGLPGSPARRAIRTGYVEFQLWEPGEQGHPNGYWTRAGDQESFIPEPKP